MKCTDANKSDGRTDDQTSLCLCEGHYHGELYGENNELTRLSLEAAVEILEFLREVTDISRLQGTCPLTYDHSINICSFATPFNKC